MAQMAQPKTQKAFPDVHFFQTSLPLSSLFSKKQRLRVKTVSLSVCFYRLPFHLNLF